jgi:RimJ/RimL family protein N-acetyltransferase
VAQLKQAPVLESARLKLRPHGLDDFAPCAAMWADPIVARYIGGKPLSEEEAWTKLLRYAGHWSVMGFGYWAVEEKETSCFIGELGFADYKRDILPPLGTTPEAGWIFSPAAHGKGYASEALGEVLAWSETHFEGGRTVCLIHPENAASIRLAEKHSYRELRRTSYRDRPAIVFSRGEEAKL